MNIHKLIEEELNKVLKEAAELGTEQNPFPSLAAFQDYVGKSTPQQLANKGIYYKYSPDTTYVSIHNKFGKQIATVSPEKYEQYSGQQQLAAQSMKKRQFTECDLAEFIQERIKTKVKITNPILLKKLSDRKMGFVTATVANSLIKKAKEKGAKIDLQPIQISDIGFRKACEHDPYKIQKYKKLFELFSPEEIAQITKQATTSGTTAQTSAASATEIPASATKTFGTRDKPFERKEDMVWERIPNEMKQSGIYYKESGRLKVLKPVAGDPNAFDVQDLGALPQEQTQESKTTLRGIILKELLKVL